MRGDAELPLPMRPAGLKGRLFGTVMERLNRPCYRKVLELLDPRPNQHFIEIGFGTGKLVELLLDAAAGVHVAGVDPTETMLEVALGRRVVARAADRVDLRLGADHPLRWPDETFHGAAALHSFQFWPDPRRTLSELLRVLRPGRLLVLALRDHSARAPSWLPNPVSRSDDEVLGTLRLLEEVGFEGVTRGEPAGHSTTVVAVKPPHR